MSTHLPRTRKTDEAGFTLVELLVVIVILGILAAVVVFAVGGIQDKGQGSACEIDTRTIRTAEEAFFAQPSTGGKYSTHDGLVPNFLSKRSILHDVQPVPDAATATSYRVTIVGTKCRKSGTTATDGTEVGVNGAI